MRSWTAPLGQGEVLQRLVRQARARRMHHGLLITGGPGIGKSHTADYLARALLCTGADPAAPCDLDGAAVCPACTRIADHPDLRRVEIPADRDEIPVDLVRELCDGLQRASVEGRARVVVVDPADRLNAQGQNALLKTLEEPGRDTFLLLATRRPEALLDTVRSRVAELRVLPLAEAELVRELAAEIPDRARLAFATSHAEGSLGWARRLTNEEIRPLFDLVEAFVRTGQGTPVTAARAALDGVSGRVETLERARLVLWMVRTILRKELLATLAQDTPGPYSAAASDRWTTRMESLFDAEPDLAQRIPPEQVLVHAFAAVQPPAC